MRGRRIGFTTAVLALIVATAGCSAADPDAGGPAKVTVTVPSTVTVAADPASQPPATVTVTEKDGQRGPLTATVVSTATVTAAQPAGAGTATLAQCPRGVVITQPGAVLMDRPVSGHGTPTRLATAPDFSTMCLVSEPDADSSWGVEWNGRTVYIAKDLAYEQPYSNIPGLYRISGAVSGADGKQVTIRKLDTATKMSVSEKDPDADPNGSDHGMKQVPVPLGSTVGDAISALGQQGFTVDEVIRVPAGFDGELPETSTPVSSFAEFAGQPFAGFGFLGVRGRLPVLALVMPPRRVKVIVVDPTLAAAQVYAIAAG